MPNKYNHYDNYYYIHGHFFDCYKILFIQSLLLFFFFPFLYCSLLFHLMGLLRAEGKESSVGGELEICVGEVLLHIKHRTVKRKIHTSFKQRRSCSGRAVNDKSLAMIYSIIIAINKRVRIVQKRKGSSQTSVWPLSMCILPSGRRRLQYGRQQASS